MGEGYDLFVSYARADRDAIRPLAEALRERHLRVFIDDHEIDDFARITTTITRSLAASRVLLAYYSTTYPTRRACQSELTAAYLAAQRGDDPSRRILVLNPEPTMDHLHPPELRDAIFRTAPIEGDQAALVRLTVLTPLALPGPNEAEQVTDIPEEVGRARAVAEEAQRQIRNLRRVGIGAAILTVAAIGVAVVWPIISLVSDTNDRIDNLPTAERVSELSAKEAGTRKQVTDLETELDDLATQVRRLGPR